MRVDATTLGVPVRRARSATAVARWALVSLTLLAVCVALLGLLFAGSTAKLAEGVTIGGLEVGGLTVSDARALLERRGDAAVYTPVVFTAGGESYPIKPAQLGLKTDWASALASAQREGEGFGPVRGFRRLQARFFGAEVTPPVQVYAGALDYKLGQLSDAIDRSHVEASVRLRGLEVEIVRGQAGRLLDRAAAERVIVHALAQLERTGPVALPVRIDPVDVTTAELARVAAKARIALSAPVRLEHEGTRWKLPRWRIAELLALPKNGSTRLAIAGEGAETWFGKLRKTVDRKPADATFAVRPGGIDVVPAKDGYAVDVPRTAAALLAAAVSPTDRVAPLAVRTSAPQRSTAEANAMGITGVVASYRTTYGGIPNRLHNVALVSQLIDGTLIAPGGTFSFNGTTGERTSEKGFLEAPVIINGELQTGLGGGICQVSTTVFNAAYEAGLKIEERWNHALYISHYPQGRDATVNYPDQDLKFSNDSGKWLLLRTFVGQGELTVNLYGTPVDRRVETTTSPLTVTRAPPVEKIPDSTLEKGKSEVESAGVPARSTSVSRTVYAPNGEVLYEDSWSSSYVAEPRILRVGTKPKPKPELKPGDIGRIDSLVPVVDEPAEPAPAPAPTPRP